MEPVKSQAVIFNSTGSQNATGLNKLFISIPEARNGANFRFGESWCLGGSISFKFCSGREQWVVEDRGPFALFLGVS
ncbi:MAG: hypothetical protein FJ126_04955 [Deltaproteobacteria bacterium]|nr:hypothetical protein [Deltaproteobacteria bacterium]